MSNFKVAFFVINILLSSITSMNINDEVQFDHKSDYSGLPNELPTLFGMGVLRNDQDNKSSDLSSVRKYVYDNQKIIGTLPMAEQIAFLESLSSSKNLNENDFNKKITDRKIREKEIQSFMDFLTDYEKQLPYGLGAIQYTSNKYVYKSEYNQKMHNIIYNEIDLMIKAQQDEIINKLKFLDKVQKILLENRANIVYTPATSGSDLSVDSNGIANKEEIVNTFLEFFGNHEKFAQDLHVHALKAEIALSNMDGCRNFNNPERNAGESSTYLEFPRISYKKGKKPIAINGDELIGIENKTSNGFEIFKGFFPGESVRHNDSDQINSFVPRAYVDQINKANTFLLTNSPKGTLSDITDFIQKFNRTFYQDNITELFRPGTINNNKDLYSNIDLEQKCKNNFIIFYKKTSQDCNYLNYVFPPVPDPEPSYGSCPSQTLEGPLLAICEEKEYPNVMYFKEDDNGIVIEIDAISMKRSYDEILKKVYQGCFGVFTSGGKRDKDACRDVMNKKCGIDLDYHAKKLGLYDYINSNPSSFNFADKKLAAGKEEDAYKWISEHFFINDIALKPSALTGVSLILQKEGEKFFNEYLENGQPTPILPDGPNFEMNVLGCDQNACPINNEHTFKVYMNKANHFILQNSAGSLKFNLLYTIFIIGIICLI